MISPGRNWPSGPIGPAMSNGKYIIFIIICYQIIVNVPHSETQVNYLFALIKWGSRHSPCM